jgi:hypothetical protein
MLAPIINYLLAVRLNILLEGFWEVHLSAYCLAANRANFSEENALQGEFREFLF